MPAWLSGATRVDAYRDAGPMESRSVLWIDAGLGDEYSAALAAAYANATVRAPHLIVDARTGELIQMVSADRRAMWVKSDGIQVLVLAPECLSTLEGRFPQKGEAIDGRSAVLRVLGWVRSLGVPDFRPLGPPIPGHPKAAGVVAGHYSSEGKILLDPEEFPEDVDVPEGDEEEEGEFSDDE